MKCQLHASFINLHIFSLSNEFHGHIVCDIMQEVSETLSCHYVTNINLTLHPLRNVKLQSTKQGTDVSKILTAEYDTVIFSMLFLVKDRPNNLPMFSIRCNALK